MAGHRAVHTAVHAMDTPDNHTPDKPAPNSAAKPKRTISPRRAAFRAIEKSSPRKPRMLKRSPLPPRKMITAGQAQFVLPAQCIFPGDERTVKQAHAYDVKHRIAAALAPRKIVEIGIGTGYSLYALKYAAPGAQTFGFSTAAQKRINGSEPRRDEADHARKILPQTNIRELPDGAAARLPVTGDLIHLSASRSTPEVFQRLELGWAALEPGGVIVVDGFNRNGDARRAICTWLCSRRDAIEARLMTGFRGDVLICRRNDAAALEKITRLPRTHPLLRRRADRILLAGPHIGEFGHEVSCWQGWLRWNACQYDATYVICKPEHELFYADFARCNEIPAGGRYSGGGRRNDAVVIPANTDNARYHHKWGEHTMFKFGFYDQAHVLFDGPDDGRRFDVAIHARARSHRPESNWPEKNWRDLLERLSDLRIALIGRPGDCLEFAAPHVTDLRGISLAELAGVLRHRSKLIAGTSSGPLHFAAHCGCPQVVFSPDFNKERYETHWNPWEIPCRFVPGDWQPAVADAEESIRAMLAAV